MKFLNFFMVLMFATMLCSAQKIQVRTTDGKLFTYGSQFTTSTTDASYHTIGTLTLASNSAGIVEVSVTGVNATTGDGVTGAAIARFKKATGTLTLGDTTNILATVVDSGLSGATWDVTASSNNIIVRVKGKASTTVRWRCVVKQTQ